MHIVQLTPGTGNFYCGACLRDHALLRALRRMGHETLMVPMYLPLVVEEPIHQDGNRQADQIFFGGINVYLQQKLRLFRRTPRWIDRWLDSPRLLRWIGQRSNMTRPDDLSEITLSMLRGEDGRQAKEVNKLIDWLVASPKTDVVNLSNALLVGLAGPIKARLNVPVVCTLQGEDAFLDALSPPSNDEAWRALAERARDIDAFVAISQYYGDLMTRRLGLPEQRVHVVHNGIPLDDYPKPQDRPPIQSNFPVLGYFARMCPAKGLHTLVEAYIRLKTSGRCEDLKLHVAGSVTSADKSYVAAMRQKLENAGVLADVTVTANPNRTAKLAMLQGLSVFSVPATYGESFGLYILEALAAGVPVVQPRHGAFEELLAATGGGILCEPDDPARLAEQIEALLVDENRRRTLGDEGQRNVFERFSDDRMAKEVASLYGQLLKS